MTPIITLLITGKLSHLMTLKTLLLHWKKRSKAKKRILDTRNIGNLSGFSSQVLIKLDDSN